MCEAGEATKEQNGSTQEITQVYNHLSRIY